MMISTGESMLPGKNSSNVTEQSLTNKREHMPREIADTIDIRSHQRHDLRFAREIIFVVHTTIILAPVFAVVDSRRGCNIFAHKGLAEQNCVQLDAYPYLDGCCREGPQLASHC